MPGKRFRQRIAGDTALLWPLTILLLLAFGGGQFLLGVDQSPSSDDAMFLSVPKNWVNGYGWATSYSERIPFNPDLTAGASLLLPAAAMIKLFGNEPWIAGVTGFSINLSLLLLCIWQLQRYWRHAALGAIALICGCAAANPHDFPSLIGYYSGSLLYVLSALLAFDPGRKATTRALLLGLCGAIGLHIKWLMLPAFLVLWLFFIIKERRLQLLVYLVVPVLILHGGWQLFRAQTLSDYSREYQAVHQQYGHDFLLQHGSGIGQWKNAENKLLHLQRNINKNLYFVEEVLREYHLANPLRQGRPDPDHWAGWAFITLLTGLTVFFLWRLHIRAAGAIEYVLASGTVAILAYTLWFVVFSFSMTPGHFYFCKQWSVCFLFLGISQLPCLNNPPLLRWIFAISMPALVVGFLMPKDMRNEILLIERHKTARIDSLQQAADYFTQHAPENQLAGCGYGGYPRHIEYLMSASQNFFDCFDKIEDSVILDDENAYFQKNAVDVSQYRSAKEHFFARAKKQPLQYHFLWDKPVAFTLVVSLQSLGPRNQAAEMISSVCRDRVIYRNESVLAFDCRFQDLQKLDLDLLMAEIASNQRWYKTRLAPYEGRSIPVLRQTDNVTTSIEKTD